MEKDLLTVAKAAKLKGVTAAAIYAAISEGRLPHKVVLGHLAVRKADILEWTPVYHAGRRKGTPMAPETKARLSEMQKKRWAERRRGSSSSKKK